MLTEEENLTILLNSKTTFLVSDADTITKCRQNYKDIVNDPYLKDLLGIFDKKRYKIIIDENQDVHDAPNSAQHLNCYTQKQIIIGAKGLCRAEKFSELRGRISQKLCNFAMYHAYNKNKGKPYFEGSKAFEEVSKNCREKISKSR